MSEQVEVLRLEDYTFLSVENVPEVTSQERAIQEALDSYRSAQVSGYEIYKTWATSLFQQYGPSKIPYSEISALLNVFSSAIEELLNECREINSDVQSDKLITFLNHTLELFKWIHSVAEEFASKELTAFLCFGLSVIKSYLAAHAKQALGTNTSIILKKTIAIHDLILNTITINPETFNFQGDQIGCLDSLMSHLCDVGEITTKLDINTAIQTWKCTVWLATKNTDQIQCDAETLDDVIWLKRPMSFLIKEIGRNVQTVYTKKSLNKPEAQLDEYLRIPNFYLRLLQKLSSEFAHVPFPICGEFLITLSLVLMPPDYIVGTHVQKLVTGHITTGLKKLISRAYKNQLFFEYLFNDRIGDIDISESFYVILFEVIEIIILTGEAEYLNSQIVEAAFTRCSKSPHILLSIPKYNRFVEIFSALQIRFRLEKVEKILVNCVVQDDIVLALAAIDVLCTILRLSNHSTRLSAFRFWKSLNEQFAMFSNRFPALFVEVLLKRIYTLLITQQKSEIWNDFNPRVLHKDRFLAMIGLNEIPDINIQQSTVQHIEMKLMRHLQEFPKNPTKENFYTIVEYLNLLTPISLRNNKLMEVLIEYLAIATKSKKLTLLVQSIYDYLAAKVFFINDSTMLKIMNELSMQFSKFDDHATKMCYVRFLKRVSEIPQFANRSNQMLRILESEKLIKYFAKSKETNYEEIHREKNDGLLSDILKKRSLKKADLSHLPVLEEELPVTKKIKTESEVTFVLDSLEKNVEILKLMKQKGQLGSSNVERLKRIMGSIDP